MDLVRSAALKGRDRPREAFLTYVDLRVRSCGYESDRNQCCAVRIDITLGPIVQQMLFVASIALWPKLN